MAEAVTIIIGTANRADVLRRCLDSLRTVSFPADAPFELVVVDNNSRDDTAAVCKAFAADAPIPVRYVFEGNRGKSNALNRGLEAMRGDIVFFTDDDCVFTQGFAAELTREFSADPCLDGLGGKVELYDLADLPITTRLIDERTEFDDLRWLFNLVPGCNMAFRRRVFDRVGGFDPLLGPGTPRVAEDSDFLYRTFAAGFRMVYSPSLLIYHGHGRRSPADALKTKRDYVIGRGAFYMKHVLRRDTTILRMGYWELAGLVRDAVRAAAAGRLDRDAFRYAALLLRGGASYLRARVAG